MINQFQEGDRVTAKTGAYAGRLGIVREIEIENACDWWGAPKPHPAAVDFRDAAACVPFYEDELVKWDER